MNDFLKKLIFQLKNYLKPFFFIYNINIFMKLKNLNKIF
jgi:hypothetical protein